MNIEYYVFILQFILYFRQLFVFIHSYFSSNLLFDPFLFFILLFQLFFFLIHFCYSTTSTSFLTIPLLRQSLFLSFNFSFTLVISLSIVSHLLPLKTINALLYARIEKSSVPVQNLYRLQIVNFLMGYRKKLNQFSLDKFFSAKQRHI